jgi:hypothetical protein
MTVLILNHVAPTVSTKTTWAGDWTEQPLLEALTISEQAAPGHGSATLRYRYGIAIAPEIGSRAADDVPTVIAPGNFSAYYVRIEVPDLGTWYGIIQDNSDTRHGLLGETTRSGVENYTAFGLTWLLDQAKPILQSKVKYSSGTWLIDRTIPFNGGTDGRQAGSRVAWKNFDATNKCFTDSAQAVAPTAWKAADAIDYIVENFGPKNSAGTVLVPFALHEDAADFLDYELPLINYERDTPWQVINKLIDRRRGLVLSTTIVDDEVQLVISSQNAADITLPSGATIPANPNQMTYDFDNAVNVVDASVTTTLLTQYDQIVVRGERAGSVFTVRPQTNIEKDWTSTQQTAYNDAATALTGYGSLSDDDKKSANMDRRAADDLAAVFSWWRMRRTWSGRADTDPSSGSADYAFPKFDADGVEDLDTPANVQRGGLRIENYLPLRVGVDYTGEVEPDVADDDDTDADFLPPILLFKAQAVRASGDAGWVHCERLNAGYDPDSESTKRLYSHSVDLAIREDTCGLILKVQGAPQHYIAADLYSPDSSFEAIPENVGIDHDDWLATIYMKQDNYCRAQYPLEEDLPTLDLVRQLVIDVAGSFLDYLVPGTIVGVAGGELVKTDGGFVRDDRERLNDLARMAFSWYGTPRKILQLSFKGITSGFAIGHLITTIGSGATLETINTAITGITYDLQSGMTSLNTQFGELDFTV